jgi:cell wall-associated NlpC family hydrolase
MRTARFFFFLLWISGSGACVFVVGDPKGKTAISSADSSNAYAPEKDSLTAVTPVVNDTVSVRPDTVAKKLFAGKEIDTRNVQPQELVAFAKTLIGIPYRYASTDPRIGFDCSGFITYVFAHFNIVVPRSSIDFTAVGKEVPAEASKSGDLILFTGTDSTEKFVGHMGLVVSNENGQVNFIHSSSGKIYGVTISPLSGYYRTRYMKTIRIFPEKR